MVAGTPPPVILRHDRGLRRGEAAGFNTRRKVSGGCHASLPARHGWAAVRNHDHHIALAARASVCFKTQWQAEQQRPSSPTTATTNVKKTKTFGLDVSVTSQTG